MQRAWDTVQKVVAKKTRTLYKCWYKHSTFWGVDVTARQGKGSSGQWKILAQHMPDVALSMDLPKVLERAL